MRTVLLAALVLLPALAGCLNEDAPAATEGPRVAANAEDAGAVAGDAPSGAKEAYTVQAAANEAGDDKQELVAYPLNLRTNRAKAPVEQVYEGSFNQTDCMGIGLRPVAVNNRFFDLRDLMTVGDVLAYDVQLEYEARQDNWAEIHLLVGMGNRIEGHNEPIGEARGPIVQNFTGQTYRVTDDDFAFVNVNCWYGQQSGPIPFKLTVRLTFAEAAVPAETPILVTIPPGATRLIVRGVPLDPQQGVNSHFRIFGPDDALLCECGLGALDEATYWTVPAPGDHVILVDHTSNGFVSLALDTAPSADLLPLQSEWVENKVFSGDGGSVDATVNLDLPQVPLLMHAFSTAGGEETSVGAGKGVQVEVTNSRGTPLAVKWGGYLAHQVRSPAANYNQWWGIWPDRAAWGYSADHHAYAPGGHQVHVKAEAFRGDVVVLTRQYVRG